MTSERREADASPRLEPLRIDHRAAVLDFELSNRAYFAGSVSDRGEEFFERFAEHVDGLLADQQAGTCAFYVLLDGDDRVLGRFNLYALANGHATVGYRVAQHAAGRGLATAAVRELCSLARGLGVSTLTASTSHENAASRAVLLKAGFVPDGPADPAEVGGRRGSRFRRDLTP